MQDSFPGTYLKIRFQIHKLSTGELGLCKMNYLAQTFRAEVRVPQPPLAVWGSLLDFLQNVLKNTLVTHGVTKEANYNELWLSNVFVTCGRRIRLTDLDNKV